MSHFTNFHLLRLSRIPTLVTTKAGDLISNPTSIFEHSINVAKIANALKYLGAHGNLDRISKLFNPLQHQGTSLYTKPDVLGCVSPNPLYSTRNILLTNTTKE